MKSLRHIIAVSAIALATVLLLAHNIVPHHHSELQGVTACTQHSQQQTNTPGQAIIPCGPAAHSCSHEQHSHTHLSQHNHHCDHSLCTLLYEFLSAQNPNSVSHNQLAIITLPMLDLEQNLPCVDKQKFYTQRHVPLNEDKFFRDTPRRAPPVC